MTWPVVAPASSPVAELLQVARQYGTPAYAYDIACLRQQVVSLRSALPAGLDVLYSLKANPSLGLCGLIARWGLGADVASAGELFIALAAGFSPERILVGGPYKSPETLACLRSHPQALLSVDSLAELQDLARQEQPLRVLLRLRPDFPSPALVRMGPDSRFGIPYGELARCRHALSPSSALKVVGFHVFSGSQILDVAAVTRHLRGAVDLSLRAADMLGLAPEILNLGGGFGVPYEPGEPALALEPVSQELARLLERAAPARLVLELGRYVVARAGWYLTAVAVCQADARGQRVVVDGGVHQRADLCGLGLRTRALPPLVLNAHARTGSAVRETLRGGSSESLLTQVQGCLCLPEDILVEACTLPRLSAGDILAFPNAGAYGFSAAPALFLSHPAPIEVAFEGQQMELLRKRPSALTFMQGQRCLQRVGMAAPQSTEVCE